MISVEGEHKNEALYHGEIQRKRRMGKETLPDWEKREREPHGLTGMGMCDNMCLSKFIEKQ